MISDNPAPVRAIVDTIFDLESVFRQVVIDARLDGDYERELRANGAVSALRVLIDRALTITAADAPAAPEAGGLRVIRGGRA